VSKFDAVIFDMDGVLIDARDWHYDALNEALAYFGTEITREEHLNEFDGLPTKTKLLMLTERGRLPGNVHDLVNEIKQERTLRQAAQKCFPNVEHLVLLGWLKSNGYRLAVATNSIRESSTTMLKFAGVLPLLDGLVTNQDVSKPKPHPEIYIKASELLGVQPSRVLVIEDHDYGVRAAKEAGCTVIKVDGPQSVNLSLVQQTLGLLPENA
jgi:beta-phosphoglucomutase